MPHLAKKQLEQVKYASIQDYCQRLVRLDLTRLAVREKVLAARNGQDLDAIFGIEGE